MTVTLGYTGLLFVSYSIRYILLFFFNIHKMIYSKYMCTNHKNYFIFSADNGYYVP